MAASNPVSDDELQQLPERISNHFDRVRALLAEEVENEVEAAMPDRCR